MADPVLTTAIPIVTTLNDTDELLVNAGGKTARITVANAKKVLGSGGTSTGGATGSKNLVTQPGDLTDQSAWFQYDGTSLSIARVAPNELNYPTDGGSHVVYQAIPVGPNSKIQAGQTYVWGFSPTRKAGSGASGAPGKARASIYYEGAGAGPNAADVTVTDGVEYRSYVKFTVPSNATNVHLGIDGTAGGGDFTFSKLTLVAGSSDNPDATV